MASNFKLRRFSNPSTLKAIHRPLLLEFLAPHRDFLAGRGLALDESGALDYDALASILMSPDENTPDAMLDALFFVDEMSLPAFFDDLMEEARLAGINLGPDDRITPADLAVRVWLHDPDILERLHAERFLVKPKSFQSFLSTATGLPDVQYPAEAMLEALQDDLNDWFDTHKRGRGTRVFPFVREDGVWFLVRHGQPYKREGTIENGQPSSVYYRPEKFDVLVYNPGLGELAIHASTKGEKTTYCRLLGKHVFGNEAFFDIDGTDGKFTLQPILEDGRACVAVSDIEGIDEIRLSELQFRHEADQYHVEVHKADDVFTALEEISRTVHPGARLLKAGFKVRFQDAVRPRTVVIRPPNVTIFDRESDAELLNLWMGRRGFIQVTRPERDVATDPVLATT